MALTPRLLAALGGLLATGVALGTAELAAGALPGTASPVVAVGGEVIDGVPAAVKDLAIDAFGTADKVALVVGILLLLAAAGAGIGLLALRRPRLGAAGVVLFGVVGALAAFDRPSSTALDIVPSTAGALAGMVALRLLVARAAEAVESVARATDSTASAGVEGRRRFLLVAATAGAAAVCAGSVGRFLQQRFSAAASRATVVLPRPRRSLSAMPEAVEVGVTGVTPFVTPNERFYRIDTALLVPQVKAEDWELRVHGMVERELRISFDELLGRPLIEADITLACVSNEVGGDLIGNARWLGVRLADLLGEAGVSPGATQLVGRSVDGFTNGFPTEVAMERRDALVAVGMNGEPLPLEHGFPARLVVPGLYGYVSATKWLSEIELTTLDAFDGYWISRGWAKEAPIKTQSRIDVPGSGAGLTAGRVAVAGVAWAQPRGVTRVEVQVDDEDWEDARLGEELVTTTWRQWVYAWDATPGERRLRVRATDADGETQGEARVPPIPDGATGWHTITVTVG